MQNRFIVLALVSLTIIFLSLVVKVDFNQVLADATKLTTFSTENRGFIFESRLVPNASINLDLNLGSPFIGLIGGSGSSLGSSINLDINNGTPFISLKGGTAAPNTSITLDLNKSNPFIKLKGGTITANTSLNLGINNDSPFISLKGGQGILTDSSVDIDFNKGSPFIKLYGGISTLYTSINLNLRKDNPFIAIEGGISDPNAIIYLDLNRGSPFIKLNGGGNAPNASIDFDLNRGTPFIRLKSVSGAPMILYSAGAAGTPINPAGFLYVIDPPSLGGTYSVLSFFPPQPAGGKEGKALFQQVINISKIDFLPIFAKTPTTTSDIHQVATKEYVDNNIAAIKEYVDNRMRDYSDLINVDLDEDFKRLTVPGTGFRGEGVTADKLCQIKGYDYHLFVNLTSYSSPGDNFVKWWDPKENRWKKWGASQYNARIQYLQCYKIVIR